MTGEQSSIIVGSLLGDGSIAKVRYGDSFFHKKQASINLGYLQWHFNALRPWSSRIEELKTPLAGKVHLQNRFATRSDPTFTTLRKRWYPDGRKIVPADLRLDPLAVAIWFCDDGYNEVVHRSVRFATNAFTLEECSFLASELGKLGLAATVSKAPVISIAARSYLQMMEIVSPYVRLWKCFSYKIDLRQYCAPSRVNFSEQERGEILKRYHNGETQGNLAKAFSKSASAISSCLRSQIGSHRLALNNTSGVKGITWDKGHGKWIASRRVGGRTVRLGRFSSQSEAVRVLASSG